VLIFEPLQAVWRYVVLAWRRGLVRLRFSGKPFSHILVLQPANPVGATKLFHTLSPPFWPEIA
jgi:hypothetical protein